MKLALNTTVFNTATLPNGLKVIHRRSNSAVTYCGYLIAAGTRDELEREEGLAHFCEHATFKGTERRRAVDIISRLERVGGDLNAFTNKENTVYHAAILNEHFPKAVDLLTDIVFRSVYPEAELERERDVVCDEIESYNDSPSELIFDEFENLLFRNHPLGHNVLGTSETVRTFGHAAATAFTRRNYTPDRMVFFAYGDVDFNRLLAILGKAIAGIHADSFVLRADSTDSTDSFFKEIESEKSVKSVESVCKTENSVCQKESFGEVIQRRDTHQAHVMIGNRAYPMGHPDRLALYLINNILGGPAMSARLNIALRERHGLVYTVESTVSNYRDTGSWSIYYGCDQHDLKKCRRLVARELDRLMQRPLTEKQLSAAKRQLKGQLAISADSGEVVALDMGKAMLLNGRGQSQAELFEKLDAITPDQMLRVARETFAPDRLSTLVFV